MSDQPMTMSKEREAMLRERHAALRAFAHSDVVDALRELDATREALAQATTWREIAEIPAEYTETEKPVLCWTPHAMAVAYFDNGEWWILGSRGVIEATHFMLLPAPPKGTSR